ncbi:unnamed protein product [Lymnaea stagnalis]|uniref:Protein crumbs n=1 Tax=Lymnaea stagnalis TaxID=6523 RepID=A0AAV2H7W4_LYMST
MCTKEVQRRTRCGSFLLFLPQPHMPSANSLSSALTSLFILLAVSSTLPVTSQRNYAFFNPTSLITIPNSAWGLRALKQFTFRTCSDSGSLISLASSPSSITPTSSGGQELSVSLYNSSLLFSYTGASGQTRVTSAGATFTHYSWYTVQVNFLLGAVRLTVASENSSVLADVTVANSTFNADLLDVRLTGNMVIGRGFYGCMYQGPGVNFSAPGLIAQGIIWDSCPLIGMPSCSRGNSNDNDCWSDPCFNGATCIDGVNNFTCQCRPNFNGTRCENDLAYMYGCDVQPCLSGGTCEPTSGPSKFYCRCPPGFTGTLCETQIDLCRKFPCVHGVCVTGVNSYRCNCSGSGYQGVDCSVDIDECSANSSICDTYHCFNLPGGYTCECAPGFHGTPCQNINECLSQPCQNSGTCIDGINSFTCTCPPGYTSSNCGTDVDDCASNPCTSPNTACRDLVNGYKCVCKEGFSGEPPSCVDINECDLRYCKNNATCNNTIGNYTCNCLPGFVDKNCSINFNECSSNPCVNNATCNDLVNNYTCACLLGFNGRNCEHNIDDCLPNICRNAGSCQDLVHDYKCNCQPGWTGRNCDRDIDDCNPNPCLNNAACHDHLNHYNCTCPPGYSGSNCGNNINECDLFGSPCKNDGVCFDGINNYSCNCTADWMGNNCSETYNACSFQPCRNGGNCTTQPPSHSYSCACPRGFTGSNCEVDIDDCKIDSCPSYQTCYDAIENFTCGCKRGYTGVNCEIEVNECDAAPCQNGGTCTDGHGNFTCKCQQKIYDIRLVIGEKGLFKSGYTGDTCEVDINECDYFDPPICQNGGLCKDEPDGSFTCYCKSDSTSGNLYTGTLCEQRRSYCEIQPRNQTCQNGGTCRNLNTNFVCDCVPGFNGTLCEHNIDECAPKPCQYNGSCTDLINDYSCTCIDGITGKNCETNIDDCAVNPCLHGGHCVDRINNYTCDCTGTGFNGTQCETNIDDCVDNPCQHGGTCRDGVKEYNCSCLQGYRGLNCSEDIPECTPNPCLYNSLCLEYSNKTLYDKGNPNFVNFTYEKAAGYLCQCVAGVTGPNCSIEINECDSNPCFHNSTCEDRFNNFFCRCAPGYQGVTCNEEINECNVFKPCQNGGTCVDKVADYNCTCPAAEPNRENFGGKNCTTRLTGCQGINCNNGACVPKLVGIQHWYDCRCSTGFTGVVCDVPTVVSFGKGEDYIMERWSDSQLELSLRFRTSVSDAVLLLCKLTGNVDYILVQLLRGRIQIKYKSTSAQTWMLNTLAPVNDSNFHTLAMTLSNNITVSLPSDNCNNETTMAPQKCVVTHTFVGTIPVVSWAYIGSVNASGIVNELFPRSYIGCMEDIFLNKTLYYLGQPNGNYIGISPGCSRVTQCEASSCRRQGNCEDLWDSYLCHCNRPYYGQDCELQYPAVTFGLLPGSYAQYSLPPISVVIDNSMISFFFITRSEQAFIMLASNGNTMNSSYQSFLVLYLKNGRLAIDFFKCGYSVTFSTVRTASDGLRHFVSVEVKNTYLALRLDSEIVYQNVSASHTVCDQSFGFYVLALTLGKYQGLGSRQKRDLTAVQKDSWFENVQWRYRRQANTGEVYLAMPGFEGVIQDLEINNVKRNFTNLSASQNLTQGALSTRNVCQDQPCENGGNCTEAFYNDFTCTCIRGYRGKNCSELNFCSFGSCPEESECVNIPSGYECVSEASFLFDSSSVTYTINGTMPAPVLTFQFRTRALYGLIFLLRQGEYFFKVRVANGRLEANSKLSSSFSETTKTIQQKPVNDGRWYSARFEVINETYLRLQVFYENALYDDTNNRVINGSTIDIGGMIDSAEIVLGNTLRAKYTREWEANFRGCLRDVRLGGVLMPFYTDDTFVNNTAPVKFLAERIEGIFHHCTGRDVCTNRICLNGGHCEDEWNDFTCRCNVGFEDRLCERNPNNCAGNPCRNGGLCVDGLSTSTCKCPVGFSGPRCENDLSLCDATSGSQCLNNATCVDRGHDFTCNCSSQEFTGWFCNVTTRQNCSGSPCLHSGSCTDLSITIGAETNVSSFNCTCRTGYEGPLCEREIDYCNKDGVVCANNGNCLNHPESQSFECLCNGTGYSGHNCTESINTCTLTCDNGQCLTDGQNQTCKCTAGYDGPTCSVPLDLCQNMSMCQHGQCNDTGCNCTGSGWNGKASHCDVQKNECEDPDPICLHGGNCTDIEGGFKCNCSLGYEGDRCDRPNCSAVACLNNGHCIANSTDWSCKCPEFVEGSLCDSVGPCFNKPCDQSNTISCTQNITLQNYTCVCGPGWKGANCTQDIDECLESDPLLKNRCVNGTCVNTNGSYLCNCTPGYTGQLCGDEINECETAPCAHGTCSDMINKFVCNCTGTGYMGETCSEDIDECLTVTRVCNDGTCKNLPGNYSCDCGDQYLGTNCDVLNPCYNKTCQNGGTCQTSNNFTSSSCMCSVGYEGVTCEKVGHVRYISDSIKQLALVMAQCARLSDIDNFSSKPTFIMTARSKRATRGAYSPSQQETMGSRVELGNVLKKPPEERLI